MPARRPTLLYGLLAIIFAVTLVYQLRYLPALAQRENRDIPFFFVQLDGDRIGYISSEAIQLGIHKNDRLLMVNGAPFTGSASLGSALNAARPGVPFTVTLLPQDKPQGPPRTIAVPVTAAITQSWDRSSDLLLGFVLPAFSLLLGFWVAFRRPRDPMAWLLLGLMLSFPHVVQAFIVQGWAPGWRVAGVLYDSTLNAAFPILMYLFGRYFPEPFTRGSSYERVWKAIGWFCAIPFALLALCVIVETVGSLDNYQSMEPLRRTMAHFNIPGPITAFTLVGSFFAALGIKMGLSQSPDAKRRLRFLLCGAMAAFVPVLIPSLIAMAAGQSQSEMFPSWLMGLLSIFLLLFPITLAYVIVVQKAMGVGVALRQGLQYTFARGGVRVLQWIASGSVIAAGVTMAANANQNRLLKIIVILVGIAAYFTIRHLGDRLRTWIDRRFFRESYDAEHLLSELSEQVRSMTEPRSLLETVAARISETLHIPEVAVLLAGGGLFRPAFGIGYPALPPVTFPSQTGTAAMLKNQKEPARVFLNDRDSWLYSEDGIGEEERGKLAALRAELLLPLAVRDRLLGFISLGPKRSEEPYTRSDVRLLQSVAAQTGLALENANLVRTIAEEVAQRERLNREVEIAREVQERLFPQKLPAIQGLDYAGHCRPALGVGGDYYDFLALPKGQLGLAIGDVSGKGIAAALMMASLQASLRSEATRAPENLAAAVANINRLVYEASSSNRYATFFYGQYDPANGRFDYVNAGHNSPMVFRRSGTADELVRLEPGGTVVGLLADAVYEQGWVTLSPGDLLVAFTDGISEAMDVDDEEWGEERLIEAVRASPMLTPAKQLLDALFEQATAFAGAAPQHDDMTLVVLQVHAG